MSSAGTQFANVHSKLMSLGAIYAKSERFFPVSYLTQILEERACEKKWKVNGVHCLLREMGVTTVTLFKIYDMMFKAKVGVVGVTLSACTCMYMCM